MAGLHLTLGRYFFPIAVGLRIVKYIFPVLFWQTHLKGKLSLDRIGMRIIDKGAGASVQDFLFSGRQRNRRLQFFS